MASKQIHSWSWYWKQIYKYPFITSLFYKLIVFILSIAGMFLFFGLAQGVCVVGFFISSISLFWPYLSQNAPSKRTDVRTLLKAYETPSTSPSRLSVKIIFDKRKYLERLKDTIQAIKKADLSFQQKIDISLQQLRNLDYLMVVVGRQKTGYIQYIFDMEMINLEIPLPKLKPEKIKNLKRVIKNNKLYPSVIIGGSQFKPGIYYTKENWNYENKKPFLIYTFHCRKKYDRAAKLGLEILSEVHGWNESEKLTLEVGTFNDGWWHNL